MKRTLARQQRIAEWQNWRDESIKLLQSHIEAQTTILLLDDPPTKNMKVSGHLREWTQKKAIMVMLFLKFMYQRDAILSHFETGSPHALDIATDVAELVGSSYATVYRAYLEWRQGERTLEDDRVLCPGDFFAPLRGAYERRFLLHEEDLKTKFKKWTRKNLRKLSVELAWKYLNETLPKEIDESTLRAHGISLPISKDTAHCWMLKCSAGRRDTKKTYYNNQHQNKEVLAHRDKYIETLRRLQRRMRVWVLLSSEEEAAYVERRRQSPVPDAMSLGKN